MTEASFRKQVLDLFGQVLTKLQDHDQRFDRIEARIDTQGEKIDGLERQMNQGFEAISDAFDEARKEREENRQAIVEIRRTQTN
jgi:hypothetical protein